MKLIPRWGICLCLGAMAISCVSSKKYNELLQKQEDCATENRDLKMAKQDCDASLVESQSLNDRLQADLDNTRTELDTLRRNYILMAADLADLQENYKQIDAEYKSSVSGKDALTEQLSLKETELAEKEKLLNSQSENWPNFKPSSTRKISKSTTCGTLLAKPCSASGTKAFPSR